MAAEIVEDDDAARFELGDEELLDPCGEAFAIDRAIEDAGSNDPIVPEAGDEGQRLPVPMRHFIDQRLALRAPAMGARHVRLGPGLVDEDHPLGVYPALDPVPAIAAADDIGPVLLFGEERLFLNVLPQRFRNRHSVSQQTTTPRSSRRSASSSCRVGSFFCSIRAISQSRSLSSKGRRWPPTLPGCVDLRARHACAQRTPVAALTSSIRAAARADMPRSSARQKRTRKSCDNGLIPAGLLTSSQLDDVDAPALADSGYAVGPTMEEEERSR